MMTQFGAQMKSSLFKSFALVAAFAISNSASAQNIDVSPEQAVISKQELAAIYVLSEICPKYIKDQVKLDAGYKKLAAEYLPNEKNPVDSLKKMSQEASFKSILAEAQLDARQAGEKKNKAICTDLSAYSN